jgi:DNA-binding transcriptional LysR family regulator
MATDFDTTEEVAYTICIVLKIRSVDLNLLPVFEAAYEERSLSRAAEKLAMTQSAVSHAMARLRTLFNDELFVRQSRGMVPTRVADMVYGKVRGALAGVRAAVDETRGFDPRTSQRNFFVAISHPLGPLMAVRLREQLARLAPGVEVEFSTRSRPIEQERALREGRIDAAIDWLVPGGDQFSVAIVFRDDLVFMARRDHPLLEERSAARVIQSGEFVNLRPRVAGDHPVPALLAVQRLRLRVALEVSEVMELFMVASQSDLLTMVPRSMETFTRQTFDLRVLRSIPKTGLIPVHLIWHKSRDSDRAHAFLRKQLMVCAKPGAFIAKNAPRGKRSPIGRASRTAR